ncbi:formate dehydrogenase accessory sulfurtransferase FdhD [Caulobacter sp. S45]|uniref:formate dehydrogenase accessory sulfurtransferase FdhD n=1 Tax=Caulobacter sp. S45 TaxID=1641861 RepID=UPI0015776903|nr:formate dehydrogenase accessory sulfurtransferase FdhD [Caulobacter sp. S45]
MEGWRSGERTRWREGVVDLGVRVLAEETPVAIVYDASTYAVMMATPADLEDFALGLSLTEGVIASAEEVASIEIAEGDRGIEARVWLKPGRREALAARRRRLAGPTGCGLCGIDSLAEASRTPPQVCAQLRLAPPEVLGAVEALGKAQSLGQLTRGVHAAAFWTPGQDLVATREDVGRHNALDKLAGALARNGVKGNEGAVVLTSRVSVEMVQKAAMIGAGVLIAVSAPTTLAMATADAAGMTLVAVARSDGFEVFTHPDRIVL